MLYSFSALDAYYRLPSAPIRFLYHEGDLISLSADHDGLDFPGLSYADAVVDGPESDQRFVCSEGSCHAAFPILRLSHRPENHYFDARENRHELLLTRHSGLAGGDSTDEQRLFESAILAARYGIGGLDTAALADLRIPANLPARYQRDLLFMLLASPDPAAGLEQLRHCGFLEAYWPELAELCTVDQAKDFHPEGDAWRHTMETFSHRKTANLSLSLGLLLHDIGKSSASSHQGRRFDRHADIGGELAHRFLRRLECSDRLVQDVCFLVRHHMLPAALPRLPAYRVENQLRNPLFPVLLEVYRCDELSTFRGPEGYYAACASYRDWCKRNKNLLTSVS